jgi:hypothetical protein
VVSITMSTAPVPPTDDGVVSSILHGHVLDDVPEYHQDGEAHRPE